MIDRDDIMHMANQAAGQSWGNEEHLQRFAALVAAAEREACYQIALTIGDDDAGCRHTDEVARRIRTRGNT